MDSQLIISFSSHYITIAKLIILYHFQHSFKTQPNFKIKPITKYIAIDTRPTKNTLFSSVLNSTCLNIILKNTMAIVNSKML